MLDPDEILRRRGERLYGSGGEELGTVDAIFLDDAEDRPAWALVDAAGGQRLVPLQGATVQGDGLAVPQDAERVASAPAVDAGDRLAPEDEATLRAHYAGDRTPDAGGRSTTDDDGRGPVVVRHEEQLRVRPQAMARRVRVRKEVVTEHRQVTVPVRREVLRVEEVEGDEGLVEVPDADAPPPEPLELILHEEEVVVTTTAVPTERIRVHVDRSDVSRTVGATVRRERIDVDPPQDGRGVR